MRWVRSMLCSILISMVAMVGHLSLPAQASEIETSVVQLDLNGVKYTDDFELYDDGEAVLLPLNALGKLLDVQVALDPVSMSATVGRPWDGKTAVVDIKSQILHWNDGTIVLSPPALAGAGDFFVPVSAIELILDTHVIWTTETQTLEVSTDRQLSIMRPKALAPTPQQVSESPVESWEPINRVPILSLGSVQYVLVHEQASNKEKHPTKDTLSVDAHLQMLGIPIDISGKGSNIYSPDRQWELQRATATYRSPVLEIVAGDTSFGFDRVLQEQDIRGLKLSAPSSWRSTSLFAVTSIQGTVLPGSEVSLMVDDYFIGKQVTEDGNYAFPSIPLQITKTNKLELTIVEPDGTRRVENRYITATPRLLPKGDTEFRAGGGWVRGDDEQPWQALVVGSSVRSGIASWLTVGGEIARQAIVGPNNEMTQPGDLAANVGLALRATDDLVVCVDWFVSGEENNAEAPAQGWEGTANLQLGKIAFQGIVYYRQPELNLPATMADTQGYKVIAEFDVTKGWNLQASLEKAKPVSTPLGQTQTTVSVTSRWAYSPSSSTMLTLEHKVGNSSRVVITQNLSNAETGTELKIEADGQWLEKKTSGIVFTAALGKLDLRQEVSPVTYLGAKYNRSFERSLQQPGNVLSPFLRRSTAEADITWVPGSTYIRAAANAKTIRSDGDNITPYDEKHFSLSVSHSLGAGVAGVSTEYTNSTLGSQTSTYLSNALQVGMQTSFGLSSQLRLSYTQPLSAINGVESLMGSLKSGLTLRNGMYLALNSQVESKKTTVGWSQPEYFIGFSLSQGLGFSNGGIRGFRATNGRPMSYVEGVVFIDTNKNGKLDSGEKTVAGAPVGLAGRRTKTDENGRYRFQFVETGIYKLGLDIANLSADFTPLTDAVVVRVTPNANISQDFAVTLNGTADGIVFVDLNDDGIPQEDEPRFAWIKVLLDGTQECFTDNRGAFTFGNINLGEHVLSVDSSHIPEGTLAPKAVTIQIDENNLDAWDILLPLRLQQ